MEEPTQNTAGAEGDLQFSPIKDAKPTAPPAETAPQPATPPTEVAEPVMPTTEAVQPATPPAEAVQPTEPVLQPTEPSSAEPTEVPATETSAVAETSGQTALQITLDQLVNLCIEKEASDIHFREGGHVGLRVGGKIIFIENVEVLTKEETTAIIDAMMPDEDVKKKLDREREIDFSYTHTNGINFRVNAFFQKGKLAGVMRMISKHIPTLEEVGVPEAVKNFLNLRQGLILVCGGAGSGKSTTTQAILEYINENFVKHILTIENPIEYVFEDKQSIFTQREVGKDTLTEAIALKSAFREDADVVMISGINNFDTLDKAIDLVETGHLVIANMLTRDATQTVERMVNYYPHELRRQAQDRIADNLTLVLVQDLVQRTDQEGRVAVFELMIKNQSIHEIIKRGNFEQLRTAIQSSAGEGMITMDSYAYELVDQGVVNQDSVAEYLHPEEQ